MFADGISAANGERTKTSVGRLFLADHMPTWGAEWKAQGERVKDYKISAGFGVMSSHFTRSFHAGEVRLVILKQGAAAPTFRPQAIKDRDRRELRGTETRGHSRFTAGAPAG